MKRIVLLITTIIFSVVLLKAQQGVGVTNPHASSALEISSTVKGLLIPRMTTAQMNAVSSPANGLMIYNTTDGCVYVYRTSVWLSTCSATYAMAWGLLGNGGTTAATNFIGTTDAVDFVTRTNNTEKMRVTSAGNVGIGTTTPSDKLHVVGDFRIVGSGGGYFKSWGETDIEYDGGTDGLMTFRNNFIGGSTRFLGENTPSSIEIIRLKNDGTIGIGTTTPQYKLDIDARTGSLGNPLRLSGLNAGATSDSIISSNSGILRRLSISQILGNAWQLGGNSVSSVQNIGTTSNFALPFITNNAERMRITEGGNVGIGTTNPQAKLHIQGSVLLGTGIGGSTNGLPFGFGGTDNALWFSPYNNASSTDYGVIYSDFAAGDVTTLNILSGDNRIGTSVDDKVFIGNVDFSTSDRQGITVYRGNLGVNASTPAYKLDIDAQTGSAGNPLRLLGLNAGATSDSIISSSSGILRRLSISQVLANAWNILGNAGTSAATNFIGTTDAVDFVTRTNNTEKMRVTSAGNVGIGTTAPQYNLDVNGTALLRNGNSVGVYTNNQLLFGWAGSNTYMHALKTRHSSSTTFDNAMDFYLWKFGIDAAGTVGTQQVMTLQGNNNGSVGIGTTNPQYKLDIDAQTGSSGNPLRLLGLNAGATSDSIISSSSGILRRLSISQILGNAWNITGNTGTTAATNFIGTTDAVDFVTRTNNTEKMRVTSAGNVGIGTTTPQYKLDLANGTLGFGNANSRTETRDDAGLQGNAGAQSGFFQTSTPTNYPSGAAGWWHLIDTRHSNSTNNYALQVAGSFFDQELWFRKTNSSATTAWSRLLSTSNLNSYGWGLTGNSGTTAGTNFVGTTDAVDFVTRTNNTEKMRVTSAGNIGIGTTAPIQTLDVNGRINLTNGVIQRGGTAITATADLGLYSNVPGNWLRLGTNNGSIRFFSDLNGTGSIGTTANMTIEAGNVGINTSSPQYKLDIDAQTGSVGNPLRLLGLNQGAAGDSVLTSLSGVVRRRSVAEILGASSGWSITGNSSTVDGTNFLGTTDDIPFNIRVNNQKAGRIDRTLQNTFFGYQVGNVNSAANNAFIGYLSGAANTTGDRNTFVGSLSGSLNTIGTENTAIGHQALSSNTTGDDNTALGEESLRSNTTGIGNTAVGESSLESNTTASFNTANGYEAMFLNTIGTSNVAMGYRALKGNTTASRNIAIGQDAINNQSFSNGGVEWDSDNIGIGFQSLQFSQPTSTTNGYRNLAIGSRALGANTIGESNVAIGYEAGNNNTTGSNNTLLGYNANVASATLTNATAIGNGATVSSSNRIRLGNTAITNVETYGNFTTISDRRLKNNITDNAIGLNFIKAVRPVQYELKSQTGIVYDGFVAQEIDSIMQKQGIKNFSGLSRPQNAENTEGGYFTVSYSTFVVPLVNAVKELDAKHEKVVDENTHLKAELDRIKAENATLKANIDRNSKDIESIKAQLGIKN